MTREEADTLQGSLNAYIELRASEDKRKRRMAMILKMQLATFIEPLIPEVKPGGGDMDLTAIADPFLSALGFDLSMCKSYVPAVDGCDDAPDDMDEEEYVRLYCVEVPGDITKEALSIRSSRTMFEMALKKEGGK